MKRIFLFLVICSLSICGVFGAYLKNVPQKLVQPDGIVVNCFVTGDEFYRVFQDSAGYTIVKHPQTGYFVYALPMNDSLTHSDYIVGKANPQTLGLTKGVRLSSAKIMAIRKAFEAEYEATHKTHKAVAAKGKINNIVIFISFADDSVFSQTTYPTEMQKFNDSSSASAVSVYNYYRTVSYGQFYLESHFFPIQNGTNIISYHDTYARSYFKVYDQSNTNGYTTESERRTREHALLRRAVNAVKSSIPSTLNLDYNNDGYVDNVAFIVNGQTEGWSNLLWPHRWSLSTYDVRINGKRVYDYNFLIESDNTVGVITHELFHTLGAPDLYNYDGDLNPVGIWDLMASTNRGKPQGLGAYMKYKYGGWIAEPTTLTTPGTYTLYPANGSATNKLAYKIPILNTNEYLLLEYRRAISSSFDSPLPGSGIIIYRINPSERGNSDYDGSSSFNEVYVFRPGGTKTVNGSVSTAYFNASVNRTSFNENTSPYPFLKDGTPVQNIYISNITAAGDSIQFTYSSTIISVALDKTSMIFGCNAGEKDTVTVTATGHWEATGLDTSWLSVNRISGDSGVTKMIVTTKTANSITLPRSCSLSFASVHDNKTLTITQKPDVPATCGIYSNLNVQSNLVLVGTVSGVTEVGELIGVTETLVSDSMRVFIGAIIGNQPNDTLTFTLYNVNRSNMPGTVLKTVKLPVSSLKFTSWNVIHFDEPMVFTRNFVVAYPTSTQLGSTINIIAMDYDGKSQSEATMYYNNGQWRKVSETALSNKNTLSLPVELYVCPQSPASDYLTVTPNVVSLNGKAGASAKISVQSNTQWTLSHTPADSLLHIYPSLSDSQIIVSVDKENRGLPQRYSFYVRSGSLIRQVTINRQTRALFADKDEIELEGEELSFDTINIYTNDSVQWYFSTNDDFMANPTDGAGNQNVSIVAQHSNVTPSIYVDTLYIYSQVDTFPIVVRQKSALAIADNELNKIKLFPNPAKDRLQLFCSEKANIESVEVFNMLGQNIVCDIKQEDALITICLDNCHSGVYMLRIRNEKAQIVKRFVVE